MIRTYVLKEVQNGCNRDQTEAGREVHRYPSAPHPGGSSRECARLVSLVERTSELSDGVLKSLETGERTAIEALGQFLITIEEALPQR